MATRGYRNLSCCYSYKNDTINAIACLAKAENAGNSISDPREKLEALGAIEYARCKIRKKEGDFPMAIKALDAACEYYNKLSQTFPDTKKRNDDRTVKIYRERGAQYLSMNTDNAIDKAFDSLARGLQLAQKTLNYDNIIICCTYLAEIQIKRGALEAAEGIISIATDCISKIDTPSIIDEFEKVQRKLEMEKYGT